MFGAFRGAVAKWMRGMIGTALPTYLAPVIGLIEVVRVLIRPITLALRLRANMMAGHVILALVIRFRVRLSFPLRLLVGLVVVGLHLFELGVCLVQAYVFVLLLRIYFREWVWIGGKRWQ